MHKHCTPSLLPLVYQTPFIQMQPPAGSLQRPLLLHTPSRHQLYPPQQPHMTDLLPHDKDSDQD